MPKIVNNRGQFKITIPKEIALSKEWNDSTILRFVEDKDGNIILKEIPIDKKHQAPKKNIR